MSLTSIPKAINLELVTCTDSDNLTFREKIKYIATHITVEPLIFFYILSGTMGLLTTQNTHLEKACRVNIRYNASVCDAMLNRDRSGYEDHQEAEVQKLAAQMLTIKTAMSGFFPTVLVLFLGSWSDRHRRKKPVILFPIFCDIVSGIELIICAHFFMQIPIEYVALSDCFPYALGGGWTCVFLGVFSYISGISTHEERTLRIGTVSMFQSVGITIGNILGGTLMRPLGLEGAYIVSDTLMLGAFIYGIIVIKEAKYESTDGSVEKKSFLADFFDLHHVKNTFKVCFRGETNNRKWKMIIIMMATVLITGPLQGELAVIYLYTRIKFGWNEVDYTIYNTIQFVLQISGSVFALSYFSKKLKMDDASLGIIALISKVSACVIYAFAPSGRFFFLGSFIEIFHGTCHIALRSVMGKIVPPYELGQSNSVFGLCESLMPLMFGPFYTLLYNYTLKVFPGAFYLVSASLYFCTIPLFIWLYKSNKREQTITLQKETRAELEENLLVKAILNQRKKSMDLMNK